MSTGANRLTYKEAKFKVINTFQLHLNVLQIFLGILRFVKILPLKSIDDKNLSVSQITDLFAFDQLSLCTLFRSPVCQCSTFDK